MLFASFPFVVQAQGGDRKQLPQNFEYYKDKVAEIKGEDLTLARQYADSMLRAAAVALDSLKMAEAMKNVGDLNSDAGEYAEAIKWFHRGLSLANQVGDRSMVVRIHNNLGGVYLKTANYEKALSQYNRAYSLGRSILSPLQRATLLNNLGIIYRYLKQYQQSKLYLTEALELYQQQENILGIGQVYNNLGILAQEQGEFENAEEFYLKAKALSEDNERPTGVAYASSNLASIYIEQKLPEKALPYLYNSAKIKKEQDDKLGLINTYNYLGKAWMQMGRADSAIYYYKKGSLYADSIENVSKKIEVLSGLARAFDQQGKTGNLGLLYTQIINLKDSSFNQERAAQLAIAQAELDMTRKEETIKVLTEEAEQTSLKLKTRELILLFSVPMVILLAVFTVFYVRRFRSERTAHRQLLLRHEEIRAQKDKIEQQHQTITHQNLELQQANKLIEHYNSELQLVNEQLEDKIRERTRALADTYRKLSFHINNTPLAVLEWSKNLTLVRWPEQAEKIFGFKAQQVLGSPARDLSFMKDEQHQAFLESIRQGHVGLQTRQHSFQQVYQRADGDIIFVEWSHSVLTDEMGQIESVLSIANDVSLREKAYQETSQINEELDTFIYKASHDLRGPIARMQGIINLGKIESSDPQAHFYFDLLNRVSNELHNLLMRLLMVHNIHQHMLNIEHIYFYDFVENLIQDMPAQHKKQAFTFQNQIPQNLSILSDKNLLSIILLNLLDNSLTYADNHNPFIVVNAKVVHGNKLSFSVQDNGPGIAENLQEKVFDMFFQGSTKSTGMGLGLYMVRKAVRKLNGDVKLERKDGLTTFSVLLPESEVMHLIPAPEPVRI
ncbi:tetratricopeptide repeat-containing sensor histidine kinase [Cesiribacter sp. SM1]|uniref:ATP-binding protein n=1 Tax=Cesiribacter sp. SM1 TaxID=2861196 RepID=UPI001CD6C45F|nr:tetratricopeptide repeat-containing sensor histidine kinase [Cesiribacter sp. SM1]